MIVLEILLIIRNPLRKYIWLIIAGVLLYHQSVYTDATISMGIGLFSPLSYESLTMSIACIPAFLCNLLLGEMIEKNEKLSLRHTTLGIPIHARIYVLRKLLPIIMLETVFFMINILYMYIVYGSVPYNFFIFSGMTQLFMVMEILYANFYTTCGVLYGSVKNPAKLLISGFVIACICNAGSWITALTTLWLPAIIFCIVMFVYLFVVLPQHYGYKFENELVLHKLFNGVLNPSCFLAQYRYQQTSDKLLQLLFRRFDSHKLNYWKRCAVLEVVIRCHFFYILIMFLFIYVSITTKRYIFVVVSIVSFLMLCIGYRKEKEKIKLVYIDNGLKNNK